MPRVNLYVHSDPESPTTLCWKEFFTLQLPSWSFALKSAENILEGDPEHVLFPGGSGSAFAKRLGPEKCQEIVSWVDGGGSYIGVCAGAYLAVSHLRIAPLSIPDKAWERGLHEAEIEMDGASCIVNYHNGPIFEDTDAVEVWARFKSNYLAEGGFFSMVGTPAITHSRWGAGQVTLFSPHLEKSSPEMKTKLAETFEYIDRKKYSQD